MPTNGDPSYARPTVVVSRCLELVACRYNGQSIRAPLVLALQPFVDLKPVCPEVEIGLGVPRDPIRLVELKGMRRLVQPTTGRDVTGEMERFSGDYLASVGEVDGFLLKSRSPSCGIKDTKVYGGVEAKTPAGKGAGVFGGAVLERFPHAAIEDEGRLTNLRLRHHFLTRVFARAVFRRVKTAASMAELVRFHTDHKFMLLAYHQSQLRALGKIVANPDKRPIGEVLAAYEDGFGRALAHPARRTSHINVLMHGMGYVSDGLSDGEKAFFLDLLGEYRKDRVPLTSPLAIAQSWIVRFDQAYLATQRYFDPYPRELSDLRDSGSGL